MGCAVTSDLKNLQQGMQKEIKREDILLAFQQTDYLDNTSVEFKFTTEKVFFLQISTCFNCLSFDMVD